MTLVPRIKIETQEAVTLTAAGGPAVIAMIGTAQWGEVGTVQSFTSFANLLNYYKEDKSSLTMVKGADVAYNNGAFIVKAVRVASSSKVKSEKDLPGGTGAIPDVLTFSGKYEGTYGDNITVTVSAVGTGRMLVITDGQVSERYDNNGDANGYATNASIATAINAASTLVYVAVKAGSETSNLVDTTVSAQALTGGNDGSSPTDSDYTDILDGVMLLEDFDVLTIPGKSDNTFQTTIVGKLNTRATSEAKYALYFTGVTQDESISTQKARTASGERLVLTSPSFNYTERYGGSSIVLDGSYLGCAVAGVAAARDVEVSPTRKGISVNSLRVDSTKEFYNSGDLEELLSVGITPVTKIANAIKVARGVTRISDKSSIFYEINIERIVDYVKTQVNAKLESFLGEPNLARVRIVMAKETDGALHQLKLDEVISDYRPSEATQGTSPDTVNVLMTIQPTFAVNFINVTLVVGLTA